MFCDLVGRSSDALLGTDPTDLLPTRVGPTLDSPDLGRLLAGELPSLRGATWATADDGRELYIDIVSLAVAGADGRPRLLVSIEDRTEAVVSERKLRDQTTALERAQEIGRTGSWIGTHERAGAEWSLQARRIYGFPDDLAEGPSTCSQRSSTPTTCQRVNATRPTALETGHRSSSTGSPRRMASGASFMTEPRSNTTRTGSPNGSVGTVRDITEWRELEDRLRRGEKLEALGELAGGIAHDFNNLLHVISRHAELGLADGPASAAREHLQALLEPTATAERLVRQLLNFARPRTESAEIVDLNEAALGVERMLPHLIDSNIEVRVVTAPEPAPVLVDPAGLEQLLLNLAVNAGDAMPAGGLLTVSIEGGTDELMLSVSDTGEGMDEGDTEPYLRAALHDQGGGPRHGLGLAYGRANRRRCGGRIEVESSWAQGRRSSCGSRELLSSRRRSS